MMLQLCATYIRNTNLKDKHFPHCYVQRIYTNEIIKLARDQFFSNFVSGGKERNGFFKMLFKLQTQFYSIFPLELKSGKPHLNSFP